MLILLAKRRIPGAAGACASPQPTPPAGMIGWASILYYTDQEAFLVLEIRFFNRNTVSGSKPHSGSTISRS
jgi:hypothetical protein